MTEMFAPSVVGFDKRHYLFPSNDWLPKISGSKSEILPELNQKRNSA